METKELKITLEADNQWILDNAKIKIMRWLNKFKYNLELTNVRIE